MHEVKGCLENFDIVLTRQIGFKFSFSAEEKLSRKELGKEEVPKSINYKHNSVCDLATTGLISRL